MPDALARSSAVIVAALLTLVVGILVATSRPPAGARQVVAEFEDAFPLIEGMYVRVDGAIAGSVGPIEVNERGNAEVTLLLDESIEPPMADARAVIRQQDTTGDSYVAFQPNPTGSNEPLGPEGLRCELTAAGERCPRTMIAPRLDDLLNAFGEPERAGVKLILNEVAAALAERGDELNEAAFELRPALESAIVALDEVNEQNAALRDLIASAEAVSGQAAERRAELGRLIGGLEATLSATAEHGEALEAALERLPATTDRATSLLRRLGRAAHSGRQLAQELATGAPALGTTLERLPGFLDDAEATIVASRPTLALTRRLLRAALPSLEVGSDRVVTGLFDFTGAASDLINSVLGGTGDASSDGAFPALFDDDSYGVPGAGTLGRRGFGAVAVQPGDLPPYPAEHANRNWLRVSAVLNCTIFGVPIEPGCLAGVAAGGSSSPHRAASAARRDRQAHARRERGPATGPPAAPPAPPAGGLPKLPLLPGLPKLGPKQLDDLLPGRKGRGRDRDRGGVGQGRNAISDVLDFLLGP